jgi:hypothetical protein
MQSGLKKFPKQAILYIFEIDWNYAASAKKGRSSHAISDCHPLPDDSLTITASLPFDLAMLTQGREVMGASMLVIRPIATVIENKLMSITPAEDPIAAITSSTMPRPFIRKPIAGLTHG